jgi:hypothetical protein
MDPNEQATTAEPAAPGFGWMDYAGIIAAGLLAAQMADRQAFMAKLTGGLYWVPAPAMPLSSLPYVPAAK